MFKTIAFVFAVSLLLVGCSPKKVTEDSISSTNSFGRVEMSETMETKGSISMDELSGELIEAVEGNDLVKVKEIIAIQPDAINQTNSQGESPLLIATHNNSLEIAKVLIDAKADVNQQDQIQDSPFLYAGAEGKTEILAYMLEHGQPDQSIVNRYGGNALIPAAEKGHLANVKLLLEDGRSDINHQNNFGYTALIEAVALRDGSHVYLEIVQELLKYNADKTLRDHSGRTAEDYAKELGYDRMLQELQK